MSRRWVRLAVVTAIAVTATTVVTAGTAEAMPRACPAFLDAIDYDWYQVDNYAAWANINAHDKDWQDYYENMALVSLWIDQAKFDTGRAQRAGCY